MVEVSKAARKFALSSALIGALVCGIALSGSLGASCQTFGACDPCPAGQENYTCNINGSLYYDCKGSEDLAIYWCSGISPSGVVSPSNCYAGLETEETGWGSEPWEPADHVNYNEVAGHYEIDASFVTALMEDGFAPLSLDSARLALSGASGYSGYYELVNVVSGDLADELGLQNGDIIVSANGYDLNTTDEQLAAYQALKNETDIELRIRRARSFVTINYVIVP